MNILGINAFHGDSSAALFSNGRLETAIEEERLNRIKHWAGLPVGAAAECLKGTDPRELRHVAVSRNPRAHLVRKLLRTALHPYLWKRVPGRARNGVDIYRAVPQMRTQGVEIPSDVRFHTVEHHRSHMASAFFASPFEEAAVVSVDGFGDFSSAMWGVGRGNKFDIRGCLRFPHSLGMFYTAFTQFLGFPKYGDEYKMMGLAAYGSPEMFGQVREVLHADGTDVRLNLDYFKHHTTGVEMTWEGGEPALGPVYSNKMLEVFGPARVARTEVLPQHADMAASVQAVLEEAYFGLLNAVARETGQRTLCLAGGVALNCAANGKIFDMTPFRDLYVQPAAHDAGTSIGAALYVQHQVLGMPRSYVMRDVYCGPAYDDAEIGRELGAAGVQYERLNPDELLTRTAAAIADGNIVGWFQGRMEFGPRALGNRSILADPRRKQMKDILNKRIKYREPFRPFCPSILAEACGEYFETDYPSPFMVQAYRIKPSRRDRIPAVTHEDGTGRLQTVERDVNPLYWSLIERFGAMTGVPVLLNTSFNENEPIVHTPRQAIECFSRTQMDVLVIGSYFMSKAANTRLTEGKTAFAQAEPQ
ncbi:MAG TPA: carbamoyltransferase C-terminal domain-containing protein [Bryobacteraceae bacterium]|nr:carbamoyltransferase C-terminal domain-containing protein [Bryobacteraceae bacterium]